MKAWAWFSVCLVGCGCGGAGRAAQTPRDHVSRDHASRAQVPMMSSNQLASCETTRVASTTATPIGPMDSAARTAAQRGLRFLGEDTVAWQTQHNCYGCHVQAVTLDAFIVGRRNHYDVPDDHFDEVLRGLLDINGGAHGPNGFSVGGSPGHLIESSKTFGGAAIAELDEHMTDAHQDVLLQAAEAILEYQNEDGSVRSTDRRPPVVAGEMQSTTQAARTWRQAFARSADERWLSPINRAEQYIRSRAAQLTDAESTYLQDISYAIIGLLAAGASVSEPVVELLATELRDRQGDKGGWGFTHNGAPEAFATGQALYVLKRLGTSDSDPVVKAGIGWLVEHQRSDGGWGNGGDRRGEAMWAVLGLVSIDVLSIDVAGLEDGTHLGRPVTLHAEATDAGGNTARSIEVRVDDVPVARACAGEIDAEVSAESLDAGPHRIDIIATTVDGKESRRRMSFYSGNHFITRAGTRFENDTTHFSFRNVAPRGGSQIRLRVFEANDDGSRGDEVHRQQIESTPGAMLLSWDGRRSDAESAGNGRYVAELSYLQGRVVQSVELPFVRDTAEAQARRFGQVAGRIDLNNEDVEGAAVELVDDAGNVVQRATTTRNGRYRFRNLNRGNYRVRVRRPGRRTQETRVEAAPASAAQADLSL